MKRYFVFALASLSLTYGAYSQSDAQQIDDIDKLRQEIKNNISTYQKTEVECDTTGSTGYRYVYKNGSDLKLIAIEYKDKRDPGKYIDKKVEWYFSNGHLIYCEQVWTDIPTGKIVDDERFYSNDQHLIAWIKSENEKVDSTSQEFKDVDAQLVAYGNKLVWDSNPTPIKEKPHKYIMPADK
jgi:hypothetical protein